jgi:hypothetical protein
MSKEFKQVKATEKDLSEREKEFFNEAIKKYNSDNFWCYALPNPNGVVITGKTEITWFPSEITCQSAKEFYQMKALGFQVVLYRLEYLLPPFSDIYKDWLVNYSSKALADALLYYFTFTPETTQEELLEKFYWHASKEKVDEKEYSSEKFAEPRTYKKCPTITKIYPEPKEPYCAHKREFFPEVATCGRREQYDALSPD